MQAEVPVNQLTIPKLASNSYDICLRNRPRQHANCTVDLDEAEYLTIQYFCSAPLESTTGMIHYSIVPHTKSCCRFENFNSFLFCLLTFFCDKLILLQMGEMQTLASFVSKKISKVRWQPTSKHVVQKPTIFASGSWDDNVCNPT